jgi:hypothetical protein
MRKLIRHILKENRIQQELKQVIKDGNIFDAADIIGGIGNLKKIFKDNPEMSSLFEKLTGTITFYYPVVVYGDIKFPLDYEIIGRHSNIPKTNYWPEINVLYDENKLTPEENEDFKSMIKYLYDEAQHSAFKSKFEDSRIFNTNYITVKEINGEDIDLIDSGILSLTESEKLHDKLYGGNQSLNESSIKEKSLIKLIEKDGLYDFIEMTGLDFNKVRSLIKQMDNPKEILKQYIREFVLEHDGTSDGNYGSLFALRLPLSNIKYVNDILVQDSDQIAVEIWGYEEDEYGYTEQTEQYLTSINTLTNDELLSIISWMMETIEEGYWD